METKAHRGHRLGLLVKTAMLMAELQVASLAMLTGGPID